MAERNERKLGLIEKRALTKSQATFLAKEASLPVKEILELDIGSIAEKLKGHIDPYWFFMRKISGRVVQRDAVTGELRGVPGATVEVQDSDCGGFFWNIGAFSWFYPTYCVPETIATGVTDACGNFCIWVPRWLSEWVLRWRKERICWPMRRPWLEDLIDPFPELEPDLRFRDPGWIDPSPESRMRIDPRIDDRTAERLDRLIAGRDAGSLKQGLTPELRAPLRLTAPEFPKKFAKELEELTPNELEVEWHHPVGPFWTCRDIFVPEWQHVFDVPDITFKVTQNVNGTDTVIYSEGYFDIRWDDTGGGEAILEANKFAVSTDDCGGEPVPCEDTPVINKASEMPLHQAFTPPQPLFHSDATGFGVRVNRPSSDGVNPPNSAIHVPNAESPVADTLALYGCAHVGDAKYYRVMIDFGGGPQPITGVSWWVVVNPTPATASLVLITPDANGWIEILPNIDPVFKHLLMRWPTARSTYPDATYDVVLETGDAAKSLIDSSPGHTFVVDNSTPTFSTFEVRYGLNGADPSTFTLLDLTSCPTISRGAGDDIELEITWRAGATHLRDAWVSAGGCGGGSPVLHPTINDRKWYWQTSGASDSGVRTVQYTIPSTAAPGCYSVTRRATSRAYNPGAPHFDPSNGYWEADNRRYEHRSWSISIVDS